MFVAILTTPANRELLESAVHEVLLWLCLKYRGADKSLARPRRKQGTETRDFDVHISYLQTTGGILVLFIYITRLASKEIFSPSNEIHWEVGRAKDLSAPRCTFVIQSE